MPDIICLGELLIDFISINEGVSLIDSNSFHKSPGGAPANVAAGVAKLGHTSGFIGKVGNDPFGVYLKKVLDRLAVNTDCLIMDEYYRTTLSFVALKPGNLRDCMFYRNPGARDAFVAAFLVNFMRRDNRRRMYTSETDIVESLKFANAAGAIATTTIGAIPSLPDWQQVVKFMNEFK